MPLPSLAPPARRITAIARHPVSGQGGQSAVEFSLVLLPLSLILLGIIQFGFIFNTYVAMSSATREAARVGTVYGYLHGCDKAENDRLRNEAIRQSLIRTMDPLSVTSPGFSTTATSRSGACGVSGGWIENGSTWINGDVVITYLLPPGTADRDDRAGQQITVSAAYHQGLVVPLIAALLPRDAGGRMTITGVVTMVID